MVFRIFCILILITSTINAQTEWWSNVVWYQIFPERFCNGDNTNDPTIESLLNAYPNDTISPWQVHPWTSQWYELQPYEKLNGKDIWYNIQRRRYGGDIQGIINKLPYLKDLGITAIYFNPLFTAPSSHKYDAACYHHIDPHFGPDPEGDKKLVLSENPSQPETWVWTKADLLALDMIQKAHQLNIKVIFDGVFNHMGLNSFAFQDVIKNGQNSIYKDWFTIKQWPDKAAGKELDYEGWFGVKTLPELREDDNGLIKPVSDYVFACTQRWMNPHNKGTANGIDGWRLDVAYCINHQFWKDWRKHVKTINPSAYLTAEVVEPIEKLKPYLQGDEFDAVMNYNVGFNMADFFIGENTCTADKFDADLADLRTAFHPTIQPNAQQNLFDSHDTNRMTSAIVNQNKVQYRDWGKYFGWSQATNANYDTRKPTKTEEIIQKQMLVFLMTYVGAPMLYYGTEAGMWGANDPDCRKPMIWKDKTYIPENILPNQTKAAQSDAVFFDEEKYQFIQTLIQTRNKYAALRTGSFERIPNSDASIYAYKRTSAEENHSVIVVFNISNQNKKVNVLLNKGVELILKDKNSKFASSKNETNNLEIAAKGFMILLNPAK
jgi:cyclomaltodextrinase